MQKRFFIVEKDSYDFFLNVLQNGSFRNCSLRGYFGNRKMVLLWWGPLNLSLEVQSAAEFSSNPDQTPLPVIF